MVLELLFEYGEHESSSVAQILNVVPGYRLLMPMVICDHVSLQTVNVLPAALYVGSLALRTAVA